MRMSHQVSAFIAAVSAVLLMIAAVLLGEFIWALALSLAAVGFWMMTRRWQRIAPVPFPYTLRWFLQILPRPIQSPTRLAQILQPRNGEHVLEVGPGIGTHALHSHPHSVRTACLTCWTCSERCSGPSCAERALRASPISRRVKATRRTFPMPIKNSTALI